MKTTDASETLKRPGIFRRTGIFFREILILVIGIMVSFLINDYRQNRQYAKEEADVIQQLYHDLKTDSDLIHENLRDIILLQSIHQSYTAAREMHPDSVEADAIVKEVSQIISVVPFHPNRTAYVQLTVQAKIDRVKDKELLSQAIRLHDDIYQTLQLINEMHAKYVIENLSDLLFDALPAGEGRVLSASQMERLHGFIQSDAVANRMMFVIVLTYNLEQLYSIALERIESLLAYIDGHYELE